MTNTYQPKFILAEFGIELMFSKVLKNGVKMLPMFFLVLSIVYRFYFTLTISYTSMLFLPSLLRATHVLVIPQYYIGE